MRGRTSSALPGSSRMPQRSRGTRPWEGAQVLSLHTGRPPRPLRHCCWDWRERLFNSGVRKTTYWACTLSHTRQPTSLSEDPPSPDYPEPPLTQSLRRRAIYEPLVESPQTPPAYNMGDPQIYPLTLPFLAGSPVGGAGPLGIHRDGGVPWQ